MKAVRLTVNDKQWSLRFVRAIRKDGDACYGMCDYDRKVIRLENKLRGQELVDTLIHEMLHAEGWHIDEEFVARAASDIAAALYHPEVRGRT